MPLDYVSILLELHLLSERVLSQLTEFDRLFECLSDWLKQMEVKVRAPTQPQTTLDEKKAMLDTYQSFLDELTGKQCNFDELSSRVQHLRQSTADQQLVLQLTQLHSRYLELETYLKVWFFYFEASFVTWIVLLECLHAI